VLENSLIASASVEPTIWTGLSCEAVPASSRSAKTLASAVASPTMIRLGYRLSWSAWPSRRNSGENSTSRPCSLVIRSEKPTGTVDFTTGTACGATSTTVRITDSTDEVSKASVLGS
jgi:hypothetical protein